MKHLDPLLIDGLADGAPQGADASAHLLACAQCRAELAELRALTRDLRRAPQPPKGLRLDTLQRLGLRPRSSAGFGLPRWAWASALAALALAWFIPRHEAPAPQRIAASAPAQARKAPPAAAAIAAVPTAIEAPVLPSAEAPNAVGAVQDPAPMLEAPKIHTAPKEAPTPVPSFTVLVRNNLIKPGQSLGLQLELPANGIVSARIYDLRGRPIETLFEGVAGPGSLFLHWDAEGAPSGAYFVLLKSGAHSKKVQVLVAR